MCASVGGIFKFLNPFDTENFFVYKLIDLLKEALKALFVPSDERINALVDSVKSKFAFIYDIQDSVQYIQTTIDNAECTPSITIHVGKTKYTPAADIKVLDLAWYAQFKEYGDLVISGFIYALFIWRMFINLPNIIQGAGGAIGDVPAQVGDIEMYSRFGFGRSSSTTRHQNIKNGDVYRK